MERKLQEKEKELELRIIPHVAGSSEQGIVQAMSWVSIKELEIIGLKKQKGINWKKNVRKWWIRTKK